MNLKLSNLVRSISFFRLLILFAAREIGLEEKCKIASFDIINKNTTVIYISVN